MSQHGQQSQGDDQETMKLIIFGAITIVLIVMLLAAQEHKINAFLGAVSWLHVAPFAYPAIFLPVLMDIPVLGSWLFMPAVGTLDYLADGGYAYMDGSARSFVLTASGRAATLLYGGVLAWIALRGSDFRVDQKYKTRHTLETMIWMQSDMWMTSRLARYINPLKGKEISARRIADVAAKKMTLTKAGIGEVLPRDHMSIQPGTWNRALRPEEWLIATGLSFSSERYGYLTSAGGIVREIDFEFRGEWEKLRLETISETLSEQLRSPWLGPEKLRPCHKAAYAAMALFYAYDIEGGNNLLSDIGILADVTRGNRGALDKALLAEKGMMARIDAICTGPHGKKLALLGQNSAYVESAFPVFLAASRKDRGVLPPAAFIWMKAEDRLMWYIIDSVGNEAICVEAAGALAHARAEQQIMKKMRRPAVYQAARAMLEDYLDMTPERITARKDKEVRSRAPGTQLDLMRDEILRSTSEVGMGEGGKA